MKEKWGKKFKVIIENDFVLALAEVFLDFHQIIYNKIPYNVLTKCGRRILSTFLNTLPLQ